MRALVQLLKRLSRDSRAATVVEYGLILAVIVLAMLAALIGVAGATTEMWNNVSTQVQQAR